MTHQAETALFGRDSELSLIDRVFDRLPEQGAAILVTGAPGVGKSALLELASSRAVGRGLIVLRCRGVEPETQMPFSGLHQLLRPILSRVTELDVNHRKALRSAFRSTAEPTNLFQVAVATLTLLSDRAAATPILLIADDVHWLDEPTGDVLAFVARRLQSDPLVLAASSREGSETALDHADGLAMHVPRLDADSARALLDAQFPGLAPATKAQTLSAARGNPLALRELPRALEHPGAFVRGIDDLPVTERLERTFAARARELPAATWTMLLVAALNDEESLTETIQAALLVTEGQSSLQDLSPAEACKLVEVHGHALRFRHPLMRSAIRQSASSAERHSAHMALAAVLDDRPDRGVWHRAACAVGPDEEIAVALEATSARAQRRAGAAVALAALQRAAQLSEDTVRQGSRLINAAELAWGLGRHDIVSQLLEAAEALQLSSTDAARAHWVRQVVADASGTVSVEAMVVLATRLLDDSGFVCAPDFGATEAGVASAYDSAATGTFAVGKSSAPAANPQELAADVLLTAAQKCYWEGSDPDQCQRLLESASRLPASGYTVPNLLVILAIVDASPRGALIIDRLSRVRFDASTDPLTLRLYGMALATIPELSAAIPFLAAAADALRTDGSLALLARTLADYSIAAAGVGDWRLAASMAEEGHALAIATDQPQWDAILVTILARAAAQRGDHDTADTLVHEAEQKSERFRTNLVSSAISIARGQIALAIGNCDDAFGHFRRTFDRADVAYHPNPGSWVLLDLADAALQSDHRREADEIVAMLRQKAAQTRSGWLMLNVKHAEALLADGDNADALFRLALSDTSPHPFVSARLRLAYGGWLRRQGRVSEARAALRGARDAFDALGAVPWSVRSSQELLSSGDDTARRRLGSPRALTPQELKIAEMAAQGLTNREIGQRLFLSPRTVGSHLYRIFPKLGISSRAELRAGLDAGAPLRGA